MARITFYDLLLDPTGAKAFSPYTWRTRFVLNFKKIPYTTEWVEFPDIKPTLSALGIPPTKIRKDGEPYFSLPAIVDHEPNANGAESHLDSGETQFALGDSLPIALYLDKEFPDHPLFPHGTIGLQELFISNLSKSLFDINDVRYLIIRLTYRHLSPRSQEYFLETRERWEGKKLEEFLPDGPERDEHIEKARVAFDSLDKAFESTRASAKEGYFVMEGATTYADICLASWLIWYKVIAPEEVWWSHITKWNEGRWETFLGAMIEKYGRVD